MFAPLNSRTFNIGPEDVTLTVDPTQEVPYAELIAITDTNTFLEKIMGKQASVLKQPFGLLPRGVRYTSKDRASYILEYEAGFRNVLTPNWMETKLRLVNKLFFPKHYLAVTLKEDFSGVLDAWFGFSFGPNHDMKSYPIQPVFGCSTLKCDIIPTPIIHQNYKDVGSFLSSIEDQIMPQILSRLLESDFDFSVGAPNMPDQYTDESVDFMSWWFEQGEMVNNFTFSNKTESMPLELLGVDAESEEGGVDLNSIKYLDLIIYMTNVMLENNKLDDAHISSTRTFSEWFEKQEEVNI